MRQPQRLRVYHLSISFVRKVNGLRCWDQKSLLDQLKRAAVSISLNISEGCRQTTLANYLRFLGIARGSASECGTALELLGAIGALDTGLTAALMDTADHIGRMLTKLMAKERARTS